MKITTIGKLTFFYLIGLLLLACSSPQLPPLQNNATILAFGDSLTYGIGASKGSDYPSHLAKLTGFNVINAGISGETTSQGLERFDSLLAKHQPDLIILLEGGNDILRNHQYASIKSNLSRMIHQANDRQIPVILIGVPEKKLLSSSAPFYEELAEEYGLVADLSSISTLLRTPKLKADPIHLNDQGYLEFAERLTELLRSHGAL